MEFLDQNSAALPWLLVGAPPYQIAHNAIWYGGDSVGRDADRYVARQLRAADYVWLERGVTDGGLTGGTGPWSLGALLAYVDRRHADGVGVAWENQDGDRGAAEYCLAAYFLVNGDRDGFESRYRALPGDWWPGYGVSLGAPRGARYAWHGLLRRDFAGGLALLNQPGAPTRTVEVGAGYRDIDGRARSSVTLAARQGAVLMR